jgi:enoyl-CoA hydratase/carnithine racemase
LVHVMLGQPKTEPETGCDVTEKRMEFEQIRYDKSEGIATITLNRPERMNAFTPKMLDEWLAALQDAHLDAETRVIILTAEGRGFCTGMDVQAQAQGQGLLPQGRSLAAARNYLRDTVHRIPRLVAQLDKPYIAAVNGAAVGAGMDMASMCDIRVAADTARFGMTYVRMGLIPGDGGCYYLPRIVGVARALDLIWSGRLFDAEEALRVGYVSEVVPADELMAHTREYALKLAKGPAVAIQLAKRLVYRSLDVGVDQALEMAQGAMTIAQNTEDAREGPRAFMEKREPQFKGR